MMARFKRACQRSVVDQFLTLFATSLDELEQPKHVGKRFGVAY